MRMVQLSEERYVEMSLRRLMKKRIVNKVSFITPVTLAP